ncbi:tetraacyldisaccharide 4'-kinase [Aquimarina sp. 2201CG1-2-11]|uniref:tetraacyldisaccharide 4'-kinase n=1 Tax=Aquimarina discodermiae TaxID=3231043 RepID=UPI003463337D
MINILRKLLLPFVPFYYIIVWVRNKLYDLGLKKSVAYDFPIIAVGNLSVGGTGKSPMIEYLIEVLKDRVNLATLSRGYKRSTKGFHEVTMLSKAIEVGDEPLQFKKKFSDVTVAVDADRRNGIAKLRELVPQPELVLMDDAFQHRKVNAGIYILLTTYSDLYVNDIVLPTGGLREPRNGAKRADIVIVTKSPIEISEEERKRIKESLNLQQRQYLFFTSIDYKKQIISKSGEKSIDALRGVFFTLVTGIANPTPLLNYYKSLGLQFDHIGFPDHHNFTNTELEKLRKLPFIVTTEKDYMRLITDAPDINLWYQPIEVKFVSESDLFKNLIIDYIKK